MDNLIENIQVTTIEGKKPIFIDYDAIKLKNKQEEIRKEKLRQIEERKNQKQQDNDDKKDSKKNDQKQISKQNTKKVSFVGETKETGGRKSEKCNIVIIIVKWISTSMRSLLVRRSRGRI